MLLRLKITVFVDVTPCNTIFTDASEEYAVIIRVGLFVTYVAYKNREIVKN